MANINRNETLQKFEELYTTQTSFKVFNKVFIFEKFIDKVLDFNRKINFDTNYENLKIITTAEELVEIYQLRSEIYGNLGYQNEFPDYLPNMNFDFYDENSAIIYTKNNNEITSTCRLIFDSNKILPIEEKLGGITIQKELESYGHLEQAFAISTWNPNEVSKFFQKAFLKAS